MTIIRTFAVVLAAFLGGFIIAGLMFAWRAIEVKFFDMRLIELVQVSVTLLIAIFISYVIQSKISFSMKRKEIALEILASFQEKLQKVLELTSDYLITSEDKSKRSILMEFKNLSVLLGLLKEITDAEKNLKARTPELHKKLIYFKKAATDNPLQKNPKLTPDEMSTSIHERYGSLISKVYECKISLYT